MKKLLAYDKTWQVRAVTKNEDISVMSLLIGLTDLCQSKDLNIINW